MPMSKTKLKNAAIAAKSAVLPSIPKEVLDQFVTGPMSGEAVNAASMGFKKALIECALGAELSHHLGYPSGANKPEASANRLCDRISACVRRRQLLTMAHPVRRDDVKTFV